MKIDNNLILNNVFKVDENKEKEVKPFSQTLLEFVADINNDLQEGRDAKMKIVNGEVENLEQLLFKIEKAGISLKLITEIRNKALESYQEIMRMQV